MTHQIYICALIAIIVFSSGCLGGGTTKTEVISDDMLEIKEPIDIFPSSNVRPGDNLVIKMAVKNVAQSDAYLLVDTDAKKGEQGFDGDYLLTDRCNPLYQLNDQMKTIAKCAALPDNVPQIPDTDALTSCYVRISPGGSQTFEWNIKAPQESDIMKMQNVCNFKFQAAYSAKAETNTYVYFASPLEVAQSQYTDKDMNLKGDNLATYGPVAINFGTGAPQPISAARKGEDADTWTVYLNIKNVGKGIADINDLEIALPKGIEKTEQNCKLLKDILQEINTKKCTENANTDVCKELINSRDAFKIYRTSTSRIMCELTSPKDVAILTPFKFTTTAYYTYRQMLEVPIKTTPINDVT